MSEDNAITPYEIEASKLSGELVTREDLELAKTRLRHQAELFREALTIALEATKLGQCWDNLGGYPWLNEAGVYSIACQFGVNFSRPTIEKERETFDGEEVIYYTAHVEAEWRGRSLQAIGTSSTRDDFFSKRKTGQRDKEGKPVYRRLPLKEVDILSIKKKAVTNAHSNALGRFFGLRNLTWEQLAHYGIFPDKQRRVVYGGESQQGSVNEAAQELWNRISDLARAHAELMPEDKRSVEERARSLLEHFTTFVGKDGKEVPGKTSVKGMSEKQAQVTLGKVKPLWEKWDHGKLEKWDFSREAEK